MKSSNKQKRRTGEEKGHDGEGGQGKSSHRETKPGRGIAPGPATEPEASWQVRPRTQGGGKVSPGTAQSILSEKRPSQS